MRLALRWPVNVALVVGLIAGLGFSAPSCSSAPCSANTCVGGCCDATGACVSSSNAGCGSAGNLCVVCAASEQCTGGLCIVQSSGVGGGASGTGGGMEVLTPRCNATAVACQDQSIMQLRLYDTVTPDGITEEGTAPNFKSLIDARAGGASPTTAYVYMSFSRQGLVKKNLSDEAALASTDWDIALRRYVLRINSGVSGPSCTEAARTAPGTSYDTLTKTPANLSWRTEAYFAGDMCEFVPDTSGIGAPGTALSSFWTYQSCVQMTGNVYVVHLRDDRYVKLQVASYYSPDKQPGCDATGMVGTPNEAGLVRVRWAFIDPP